MARTLSEFAIARSGEEYLINIATEDGDPIELSATYEQLDLIAEAIEEQLDADEEDALAVAADD
jgi:hypothetical protein